MRHGFGGLGCGRFSMRRCRLNGRLRWCSRLRDQHNRQQEKHSKHLPRLASPSNLHCETLKCNFMNFTYCCQS